MKQVDHRKSAPVLSDALIRPLVEQALMELREKSAALEAVTHFGDAKWGLDQDTGLLRFDRPSGICITAPAQIIGTYNTVDGTWLWAWDHPSVDRALRRDAEVVLEYGEKHEIEALRTRKLACTEADCWEFTALACKLCNAQAAYRGPMGNTLIFITFGCIEVSKV